MALMVEKVNYSGSTTYVALAPLKNAEQATVDHQNEVWFEQVNEMLHKAGLRCEFNEKQGETLSQGYQRAMVKHCYMFEGRDREDVIVASSIAAPQSNFTKKYGSVVVSKIRLPFGKGNDDLVIKAAAKLKPYIDEKWVYMYPGVDSTGQRRMFVGQGDDVAMFDLPPYPFQEKKKEKKDP